VKFAAASRQQSGIAMTAAPASSSIRTWRTPAVLLVVGCVIAVITYGPRASLGLFLTPLSTANGWGRDVFATAFAIQVLVWGAGQPLAGAIADRFGITPVLSVGALMYAAGLTMMAYSSSPAMLHLNAGLFLGLGLSGCSFSMVLASFGKLMPDEWRTISFGIGTAAGSFGQFLFSPLAVGLMDAVGWQNTLMIFSAILLLVLPLSLVLATPRAESVSVGGVAAQSLTHALKEAIGHRSYVLLVIGYFTCGFQLQFITIHMPAYLIDRGMSASVGGWTIAAIGLFNAVGSAYSGYLAHRMPKRFILAAIYFSRALAILVFISFPVTPFSAIAFGAVMGFFWLSTVAPTNGLVMVMFGTRWLATLTGFAFFSHQFGGFLGVWLGGIVFERTGSYDAIWWLSIAFGVASALINLPIVEKPVVRHVAAAA
jgi:MFS family permease